MVLSTPSDLIYFQFKESLEHMNFEENGFISVLLLILSVVVLMKNMVVVENKCFLYIVKEETCLGASRAGLELFISITNSDVTFPGIAVH